MSKFCVASINAWREGSKNLADTSLNNLKAKIRTELNTTWTIRIYDFKFDLAGMVGFIEGTVLPVEKYQMRVDETGTCRRTEDG